MLSAPSAILFALVLVAPGPAASLRELLERTPPDSLIGPLRRLEARSPHGDEAGEAAYALGQLHYVRGEYVRAADAFARAAAHLEPARKGGARYWSGLAWLGAGDPTRARAALEEVARSDAALRGLARLGVALSWEASKRPEEALSALERLVDDRPGEAAPAALAHLETLATRLRRDAVARRAHERLLREWPGSLEAASARAVLDPAGTTAPATGVVGVEVGAFADVGRARALAEAARRAGFAEAQVVARGAGPALLHHVRVGEFPSAVVAQRAGERAAQALGVRFQLVKP